MAESGQESAIQLRCFGDRYCDTIASKRSSVSAFSGRTSQLLQDFSKSTIQRFIKELLLRLEVFVKAPLRFQSRRLHKITQAGFCDAVLAKPARRRFNDSLARCRSLFS